MRNHNYSSGQKKVLLTILISLLLLFFWRFRILGLIFKILGRFAIPLLIFFGIYFTLKKHWPSSKEEGQQKHVEKEGDRVIEICPKCGHVIDDQHNCADDY